MVTRRSLLPIAFLTMVYGGRFGSPPEAVFSRSADGADGSLAMDFPAWPPTQIAARSALAEALGESVQWTGRTENEFFLLALLADEGSVRGLNPDLTAVGRLDVSAVIVTAVADPGQGYDFVSRLFAPKVGIPEDPVTGAAHTVLAPFWADRLGRTSLVGLQASSQIWTGRCATERRPGDHHGPRHHRLRRHPQPSREPNVAWAGVTPKACPHSYPELPNSRCQHSGQTRREGTRI